MTKLTLTFDNGPHPEATPRVLELLRERSLRAHFYVLGKQVATEEGRALVARIVEEGHIVGNHSFTHEVPLGDDPRSSAVEEEIVATEALLAPLIGEARRFRPFGGGGVLGPHLLSERAAQHLIAHGYSCVLWSSVPCDWIDAEGWPARALEECAQQEHAVLVLHDLPGACVARLGEFLDEAKQRGFEIVDDLPPGCVPILEGQVVGDLDAIVRRAPSPPEDS